MHPGDAFRFDIFSQAGAALKASILNNHTGPLGPLAPRRMLAIGESQSAAFLTTYVNAIDPLARVYDGFLIHSRFGSSSPIDGVRGANNRGNVPEHVAFRPDLRVPVLTFITETDLLGSRLPGYHAARRGDDQHLRVWEVAGTAHADNYLFMGAFMDSGSWPIADLAKVFRPATHSMMGKVDKPFNVGLPHHYVLQASLAALDRWVKTDRAPASTPRLMLATGGKPGEPVSPMTDANGIAHGGVRTPWVDVPTMRLSPAKATRTASSACSPAAASRSTRPSWSVSTQAVRPIICAASLARSTWRSAGAMCCETTAKKFSTLPRSISTKPQPQSPPLPPDPRPVCD